MADKQMKTFNTGTTRYIITDAQAREDIAELQDQVAPLDVSAQSSDVGKALKAKTVANGKVTEYELGDAAIIDDTLSVAGEAADAKETGDAIADLDDAKVNKPTTSPNGTSGQLLRTNGDGTTTWVDQGLPTDAQTADAVSAWLDDHPEATTTVQDGAITKAKLDSNLQGTVDDVDDLKSHLGEVETGLNYHPHPVQLNKAIDTHNSTVLPANIHNETNWVGLCISCVEGDEFHISGRGGNTTRLWAFSNSVGAVLSEADSAAYANDITVTAPENAAYFAFNSRMVYSSNPVIYEVYQGQKPTDKYTEIETEITALGNAISKCVIMPYYDYVPFTRTMNKLTDNTTLSESSVSGFQTTVISVTPGDGYKISGWANNSNYKPAFWSDSEQKTVIGVDSGTFTDLEVTVPQGSTKMMVNGRTDSSPISVAKLMQDEDSTELFDTIYGAPVKQYGVHLLNTGAVHVFMKGYAKNIDLECRMQKKSGNALLDFQGWYKCPNSEREVLTESPGTETTIIASTTDFLSPAIIYAVNNIDGDFPAMTGGKFTGGWHVYGGGSGEGTATARNVSTKVFCDGVLVPSGGQMRGSNITIYIVNRLQASNTEKENGTGREVVEITYKIVFCEGFKTKVQCTIKALEEIQISRYFGISAHIASQLMSGMPFYWIGSRAKHGTTIPSSSNVNCGDKYCTQIMQFGTYDTFEMGFVPYIDLGSLYADHANYSFTSESNKVYAMLVNDGGAEVDRLILQTGEMVLWEGFYNWFPTVV